MTIALHIGGSRDIVRGVIDGTFEVGMVGARFGERRVLCEYLPPRRRG